MAGGATMALSKAFVPVFGEATMALGEGLRSTAANEAMMASHRIIAALPAASEGLGPASPMIDEDLEARMKGKRRKEKIIKEINF